MSSRREARNWKASVHLFGSLLNKSLHANLYGKKHTMSNECIHDAIDLNDNSDIYGKDKSIMGSDASSSRSTAKTERSCQVEAEAIAKMVMKKMSQGLRPLQRPIEPWVDNWCEFEQKWTNHEMKECYHWIRYLREQGFTQQPMGAQPEPEQVQPVLGNQPPYVRGCGSCCKICTTRRSSAQQSYDLTWDIIYSTRRPIPDGS